MSNKKFLDEVGLQVYHNHLQNALDKKANKDYVSDTAPVEDWRDTWFDTSEEETDITEPNTEEEVEVLSFESDNTEEELTFNEDSGEELTFNEDTIEEELTFNEE